MKPLGAQAPRTAAEQFLENTSDGVWQVDAAGKVVYVNPSLAGLLGWTAEELVGRSGFELVHPDDTAQAKLRWEKRLAGQAESFDWRLRRKDGTYLWCRVSSVPLRQHGGDIAGALVTFADISELRRVEHELRERERLYRCQAQLLELAHDVVIVRDLEDRIIFWNAAAEKSYGHPKAAALGRIAQQLLHTRFPTSRPPVLAELTRVGSWEGELAHRRADGRELTMESRWAVQYDDAGKPAAILEINRDTTAQKQLEQELHRREAHLRAALLVSRTGTYAWNLKTGEATWDDSLRHVFGLREHESITSYAEFLRHVHLEDRANVDAACQRCIKQGIDLAIQYRIVTPSGVRWIHARGKMPEPGTVPADVMIGACIDITDQASTQAELRGSQERLVAALAASHTGTFVWNIRTNTLEWDAELNRLFGLSGNETAGALPDFFALVDPQDRPAVIAACERCKNEGADFHEEFRVTLADGSVRWLEDKGKTFFGPNGRPAYMTGACVDITLRKDAERAIQLNRERFELVREASGVGFWFCDLPFGRLDWDTRVKAHFGLPPDAEVTIDTFYQRLHPEDRAPTRQAIERSISSKGAYDVEYRTVGVDGVTRWIRAIGATRYRADGTPYRFDGITIDMTENVRVRRLLQSRGEELERTVAERTASLRETVAELEKFSYSISHDLRAPLRAMQSFALILQEECEQTLSNDGKNYLRRIVVAADRMDRLIQDVLSYSKLSRGDLALQSVDLGPLVTGIVETYPNFQSAADAIRLSGSFPTVRGNEAAITQCVSNLLGNALKFARKDTKPEVKIWCESRPDGVRLCVRDNGIGIRSENLERIFALFEQVNADADAGGTGIGLAIVRKAAEKMGAKVGVESEFGVGSTFWIEFAPASLTS